MWAWWCLADVALLSFVFVQTATLGRDVVHMQFVRSGRVNTALLRPRVLRMHYQSLNYAYRRRSGCARAEFWLLVGHYALHGAILVIALGWNAALAFRPPRIVWPVHGDDLRSQPQEDAAGSESPFDRRIPARAGAHTARNIDGIWFIDLVYGGLNYQIEHHLFPCMP